MRFKQSQARAGVRAARPVGHATRHRGGHTKAAAVVNPRSAGGRTAKRWPLIAQQFGDLEARFTERPGHAIEIARQLLHAGYERIVAVGGDGTIHEVANGWMESRMEGQMDDARPINPQAAVEFVPMGTGSDFARTLAQWPGGALDLGRIAYRDHAGAPQARYFVNVASFGMGGEVAGRAKNFLTPLGGKIAFQFATIVTLLGYRAKQVRLAVDGEEHCFRILNIAIGNGEYHGGGMHVCPRARLDDGQLEVTVIDDLGMFTLLKDLPVLYSENLYVHPKTRHLRGRTVTAECDQTVRIEIDGEPLGALPVEITVVPRVFRCSLAVGEVINLPAGS